jgi:hypothetical protein
VALQAHHQLLSESPDVVLIILPDLRHPHCGLADHAAVIGAELEKRGVQCQLQYWKANHFCVSATPVLIEFTPLAYSRFGLSLSLLMQVVRWRLNGCRVITYFHELPFSNGWQWKRRLAAALQRAYCALLAAASASSLVNQETGLGWLQVFSGSKRISFLPTCSNVGESVDAPVPLKRPLQVVVFGSPGKRRHAHALVASLGGYRRLFGGDVKVIDIGEPLSIPEPIASEVTALGPLATPAIQSHLLSSRFGFFYAEPDQFSKSGVFAAYCAHGVVPIIAHSAEGMPACFLTPEEMFVGSRRVADPDSVWISCREWHRRFSVKTCANHIYNLVYGF